MVSFYLQLFVLLALPAAYAGGAALLAWSGVNRPWLFVLSCVVVMYLLYAVVILLSAPSGVGYVVVPAEQLQPGAEGYLQTTHTGRVVSSLIGEYVRPALIFTVAAIPTLWLIKKVFRR